MWTGASTAKSPTVTGYSEALINGGNDEQGQEHSKCKQPEGNVSQVQTVGVGSCVPTELSKNNVTARYIVRYIYCS